MATKNQKKAGDSAKNVGKPAIKTASKKKDAKKAGRTSAKKIKPSKAKATVKRGVQALVASKTRKKAVNAPKKSAPGKKAPGKATRKLPLKKTVTVAVKEVKAVRTAPKVAKDHRFNKKDLAKFRLELLALRERIIGQSGAMRNAALQRNDEANLEEEGTDAFIRLQTLAQVRTQQQIVANIDEALRSIEKSTYGICDMCGALISKSRLKVLPFAKNCIECQSEIEQTRYQAGRR